MRILIVGGTRFIGASVAERLAAVGHEVTVYHRGRSESPLTRELRHLHGERRELPARRAELERLAPEVAIDMMAQSEQDARVLAQALRAVAGRLLVLSSVDVYRSYELFAGLRDGPVEPSPLTEAAPLRETLYPRRAHASGPDDWRHSYDKILVEQEIGRAAIPSTILRLPFVYGPRDYRRRLARLLRAMDRGEDLVLAPAQARWRSSRVFVQNAAAAIALAAVDPRATGRIYNLGEEPLTEAEWITRVGKQAGWRGALRAVDPRGSEEAGGPRWSHHVAVSTRRIRDELGYREEVGLAEAIAQTVAWERQTDPP